jgi:SP family myo-inositol transporter-like MFS transporter 13
MVAISVVPAIILTFMLPLCSESPCQLVSHGDLEVADRVLARVYLHATPQQRAEKVRSIKESIQEATTLLRTNRSLALSNNCIPRSLTSAPLSRLAQS